MNVSAERSRTMRAVKSKNTGPEMAVRRLLHGLGYRYSLHKKDLPGKPDIVLSARGVLIFVNGCFWHGHKCKRGNRQPRENASYWISKIARNKARDARNLRALQEENWQVLSVWECEVKDLRKLAKRLTTFLNRYQPKKTIRR